MANHVAHNLRMYGDKKNIEELLKKVLSSEQYILAINDRNNKAILDTCFAVIPKNVGHVDFNILIPQPTNVFQGNLSSVEEKKYGKENCWYEWRTKHWGTPKNAHEDSVEWLEDGLVEIIFWTDWSSPKPWLNKLAVQAMQLNVEINGEYANTDFDCEMAYFSTNPDYIEDPDNEDPMHIQYSDYDKELYEKVWGEGMAETTGYFNDNE